MRYTTIFAGRSIADKFFDVLSFRSFYGPLELLSYYANMAHGLVTRSPCLRKCGADMSQQLGCEARANARVQLHVTCKLPQKALHNLLCYELVIRIRC